MGVVVDAGRSWGTFIDKGEIIGRSGIFEKSRLYVYIFFPPLPSQFVHYFVRFELRKNTGMFTETRCDFGFNLYNVVSIVESTNVGYVKASPTLPIEYTRCFHVESS